MDRHPKMGQPLPIFQAVGFCLAVSSGSVMFGCNTDYRISFNEFLQKQQEVDAPPETELSSEEYAEAKTLLDTALGPYRIGRSDVLSVSLTRLDQPDAIVPMQARVDREGEVELPVIGRVKVAGMELEDAEDVIQNSYVPAVFRDGVVHLVLLEVDTTNVFVNGAVAAPGLVPLRRTECDLLHAIVGAAGVSDVASGLVTLQRLRHPGEAMTLDLSNPDGLREALALEPLESGDVVTVEAAEPNTVFVGGLVNAPSPQLYPPGVQITFLQALAAAGGLRTDIFPREGTLIRRMSDGADLHVKLDLNRLKTGQDPNFMLAAGDILWVPDTIETRVQDFINRNFFFRAGFSANVTYNVSGIEFMNRQNLQSSGVSNSNNSSGSFNPFQLLNNNPVLQNLKTVPLGP